MHRKLVFVCPVLTVRVMYSELSKERCKRIYIFIYINFFGYVSSVAWRWWRRRDEMRGEKERRRGGGRREEEGVLC